MNVLKEKSWFGEELKKLGDAQRAEGEKKYLKSTLKFYGVRVPEVRKLDKLMLY